ncbi:prepilin peptidase [Patescibacteria group bacterium]|nr:prepilin peptidase [Patescibacteria group bacterium]
MVISSTVLKCLFLIPLLVIGVMTSYSDIKYGKIKNIHLLWGFCYALLLYSFLIYYSYFVIHQSDNLKYVVELLINGTIAFVVGYLLWHFNLWAAGDAKLFPIYSLLIPLEIYSKNYIRYFPSLILLADTFLFICLVFLLKMFYKIILFCFKYLQKPFSLSPYLSKINYQALKKPILEAGKLLLISACFLVILQYTMMKISVIHPLSYPLFFVLQMFLLKTCSKHKTLIVLIFLGGLLSGLGFIISHQTTLLIATIKLALFFMFFLSLGMQLVHLYIDRQEISRIKVLELPPGVFLASKSLAEINKVKNLSSCCSDGLTKSQVKIIQKLFKNDLTKELYVYRTFPFAPFMFLAFILMVITQRSFLFFLLRL